MDDYIVLLMLYFPLGIIGAWRWGTWIFKKLLSLSYKPITEDFDTTVSIVVPVYNEDPKTFRQALETWKASEPAEIIAVIDYTDEACITEFKDFQSQNGQTQLIITQTPGKRPALADGIRAAKGEIVALVDSDTLWNNSVMKEAIRPFADKKVWGTGTRQNVYNPKTIAQNIFDIQLDLRFYDEVMPLDGTSKVLTCLSGRTAFYRRKAILPLLEDMANETFWGKQCFGGEDKRFTYLIEATGANTRYQHEAHVYTSGATKLSTLFKQRIRWGRNTYRADLRALWQGWAWKHPIFAFFLIDKLISPFTLIVSLLYFIISLIFQLWIPAAIIFAWWILSRGVRILPNLTRRPINILLVPVYVFVSFILAIIKIYALLTLTHQDWITRRGKERKPQAGGLNLAMAKITTLVIIAALFLGLVLYKGYVTGVPTVELSSPLIAATLAGIVTWLLLSIALAAEGSTRNHY